MKAAIMREYHQPLEFVEQPRPEPVHPNDVVVRIGGAGVCATDLHAMEGLMEFAGVSLPRVLGHENAGWVEEAGSGVSTVARGDVHRQCVDSSFGHAVGRASSITLERCA